MEKGGYENRLFLQLLLLVTVPLILMGVVSGQIYIRGEAKRRSQEVVSHSKSVAAEFDGVFSSLREYYLDGIKNEDFIWLVNQTEAPYGSYRELKRVQKLLEGNFFLQKYTDMYNFYHVKYGWILSNYGIFEIQALRNRPESEDFVEEQKEVPFSIYWLNRTGFPVLYGGFPQNSGLYDTSGALLVLKESDNHGIPLYLLTVRLNLFALRETGEKYKNLGYSVTVLEDGEVLMETDPEFTEAFLSSAVYKEKGETFTATDVYEEKGGTFTVSDAAGRRYLTSAEKGKEEGIDYIIGYNMEETRQGSGIFVLAALAIVVLFALLLTVLRLAAAVFSRPMLLLQQFAADQTMQMKELFVSDLVKGELNAEKIREKLAGFKVPPRSLYRLMGISCKGEGGEVLTGEEAGTRNRRLLSGLSADIREEIFLCPILHENLLLCIIGDDDAVSLDHRTALVYKRIKDFSWEEMGAFVAVGIARPFHPLSQGGSALGECIEALHSKNHRRNENRSSLVLYDDYFLSEASIHVYDRVMEAEFLAAVAGAEQEAENLLKILLERMQGKELVGIERNFYLHRLMTGILEVGLAANLSLSEIFSENEQDILERIVQIYSSKKLFEEIKFRILLPVLEGLRKREAESEEPDVVRDVLHLIKESKGNITLNECAESLSYHPNYLSRIIKKETGKTFTELTNQETVRQAKYMLLLTEDPVAEIAQTLQYGSVQNFIRFFKKHEGITPAAFRKENRK